MNTDLLDALGIEGGIVCAVGAGGKKTTLYRIADVHGGRVAVTTTVFMAPFPKRFRGERVLTEPERIEGAVLDAAEDGDRVAYACTSEKPGRHGGVPSDRIHRIHQDGGFALTLVKADGARMRGIKAPSEREPNLPPGTDLVLYLVSAATLGEPLDEAVAHRVEKLETIMQLPRGGTIGPGHIARLLTSPEGALQGVGGARLVPVINQVDDAERHRAARAAAELALENAKGHFDRVILASMRRDRPIVEVVHGDGHPD
ncbi:MAG: selenium cofactor biosynthesis protein YqeC [Ectothiorhodospiraceae bacterium]|jgi:probable selenium-dependent hydroxylase accessory protein YqeC